jgi:hypothetical protein
MMFAQIVIGPIVRPENRATLAVFSFGACAGMPKAGIGIRRKKGRSSDAQRTKAAFATSHLAQENFTISPGDHLKARTAASGKSCAGAGLEIRMIGMFRKIRNIRKQGNNRAITGLITGDKTGVITGPEQRYYGANAPR